MNCKFLDEDSNCTLAGYEGEECVDKYCDDAEYEVDVTGQVHEYLNEQDEH